MTEAKNSNDKSKAFILAQSAMGLNLLPTKTEGFTLAEVLITLGIIGVVAAMTIPTLIANTRSQQYRSQFKKTLSTLNQAVRMAQAQYDFDFAGTDTMYANGVGCISANPNTTKSICALLNGTLSSNNNSEDRIMVAGAYGYGTILQNEGRGSQHLAYQLADGAIFIFAYDAMNCASDRVRICKGYRDVNGVTKPNKEVACASEETVYDPTTPCTVDKASMGDIFPVILHDGSVEPATNAAAYVLNTAK